MGLIKKKSPQRTAVPVVQTAQHTRAFSILDGYVPLSTPQTKLYYALREAVPIIDAAVFKIVRLAGGFKAVCENPQAQKALDGFVSHVPVGGNQLGLEAFVATYFEQLLTCGTAVGEIVTDSFGVPAALWNSPLDSVELRRNENGFAVDLYVRNGSECVKVSKPELCLLSVLNPEPGKLQGSSLLKGLPFVSSILTRIYESIGINWERAGNIRFAVTYKPQNDAVDRAYAKDRALQVAKEWGEAMQTGGAVKDFVAVGDVQIKVIGADSPIMDSEIPVRQMLEQIVAKTGLPPFMLGLSWSSTERMSSQQADLLTSELEAYRRILTPVIEKICRMFLSRSGYSDAVEVQWSDITLQDEVDLSRAMLYKAQAESLNKSNRSD